MRYNFLKATTKTAIFALCILLLAGLAYGQEVDLTAAPATAYLPDGSTVPMWGYTCSVPTGSTVGCKALNPNTTGWSPIVITVPTGTDLTIKLTNNLTFSTGTTGGNPNPATNVPTSLTIVGQLGGGLGNSATLKDSPKHDNQPTTLWAPNAGGAVFQPPPQGKRVQSFSTEVGVGQTTSLTWTAPRPGTYLLESGTHPSIQGPMGLYGIVVVQGPGGQPYAGIPAISDDVSLLLSEVDPVQNAAVQKAVSTSGFSETATSGPWLGGPVEAIAVTSGGSGYDPMNPPAVTFTGGGGGNGAQATAVVDPTTGAVTEIDVDPNNPGAGYTVAPIVTIAAPPVPSGTTATAVAALQLKGNSLGNCAGTAPACYPPVVNYAPLYFMVNGVAFDKSHPAASLFQTTSGTLPTSGSILVRMVNAGLRMHVPAIVGSTTGGKPGFGLIAEDANVLPGVTRIQNEVFMAAGKTYDVVIDAFSGNALPFYDRELSLSGNASSHDTGMYAYIGNSGSLPTDGVFDASGAGAVIAVNDTYNSLVGTNTLNVTDVSRGVISNDKNVNGVSVSTPPAGGTVTLNSNGTFTYVPNPAYWASNTSDTFAYCALNTSVNPAVCSTVTATVTIGAAPVEAAGNITVTDDAYSSNLAKKLLVKAPGVLSNDADAAGYPLTVDKASVLAGAVTGTTPIGPCASPVVAPCVQVDSNGGFSAFVNGAGTYSFIYKAKNAQGTSSANSANVVLTFLAGSGIKVSLMDGVSKMALPTDDASGNQDYRWVIEQDMTFFVDPQKIINSSTTGQNNVPAFGASFHTSYMPLIAQGCTSTDSSHSSCEQGQTMLDNDPSSPTYLTHVPAICEIGSGVCRPAGTSENGKMATLPGDVHLDPGPVGARNRYYLSVFPGDNSTGAGHSMGGIEIVYNDNPTTSCPGGWVTYPNCDSTIIVEQNPLPTAEVSVFVYEDDYPLNGENSGGGGVDILAPNEPGLGSFNITLFDDVGQSGDAVGQMTYDQFNMPLSNSLAGTIDPTTGADACPLVLQATASTAPGGDGTQKGITGVIPVCPYYESNGTTLSPLAGQAVIKNLPPGRYGVVATPGADRIARGEEWLQTNTLDGQHAHDSFIRVSEPSYFQEYGPAGYHVAIGFANPSIINARHQGVCDGITAVDPSNTCSHTVSGRITAVHMSRTPDQRLFSSGSRDAFAFTQCFVSLGSPDGADFAFSKCDGDGNFSFSNIPNGDWRISIFDQWNDQIIDGYATPLTVAGGDLNMGDVAVHQWQMNLYTRTFFDTNGDGVSEDGEPGLTFVPTNIRYRDGSYSNFNSTDLNGYAGFNEIFPLFNWYVMETDTTRYKTTGIHVVQDAGGAPDTTGAYAHMATTTYTDPSLQLPADVAFPGSVYCKTADCSAETIQSGPYYAQGGSSGLPGALSTGRIDPPYVESYGFQGFSGQGNYLEFGKKPFVPGETGGIHGHVVYASTRPFDDPTLDLQNSWEPMVPHVTINLYQESTAPDGTTSLKLIDSTQTSSWDDWAQGYRKDATGNYVTLSDGSNVPNMNCPGQTTSDPFFFTISGQQQYLDPTHKLPHNSQYKCFDGMHNWNQLQPAPYDGMYRFPSIAGRDPKSGRPVGGTNPNVAGTNCTTCVANPDDGTPMLPAGKYVVEVVVPPGYELVKEEDKNLLTGDTYIAPANQQFAGFGNIFILPDQAAVSAAYNQDNPQFPTNDQGRTTIPSHEGDTGSVEQFWPCVGEMRVVPDYLSIFPQMQLATPFAGATRPLCDRKEVVLEDQESALVKFYVFTSAHVAAHIVGIISDDFTAEFDPFAPAFGEKFSPPNLPVSVKDWAGNETQRMYADQWGAYNGLTFSSWGVNPPDPSGYVPQTMVTCMNDQGTGVQPDQLYNPGYSQFCYELTFMPGETFYADTPVVQTTAFADGYNHPDCNYPDATPAILRVDSSDSTGPWAQSSGGSVSQVNVTNGGNNYTSAPTVSFTGGGGTGATATAHISGSVTSLTLGNHGSGYSSSAAVTFLLGGGSGAAATVNVGYALANPGGVTVDAGGSRYTGRATSTIGATGAGGTNAALTNATTTGTFMKVSELIRSAGGSGYTSAPGVTISAPTGCTAAQRVTATATAQISGGVVTGFTITNPGTCYIARPTVTFSNAGHGGTGVAAAASNTTGVFLSVNNIVPSAVGSGYRTSPAVTVSAPTGTGGTTATAHANLASTGGLYDLTLTNGGSGYTAAPTVAFSGGGSGATATAKITESVTSVTVTNGGSGYSSAPTVAFSGGGGTGAAATAVVPAGSTLTITALGDQQIVNNAYSGPSVTQSPFNLPKITRHYGFGPQCTSIGGSCAAISSVTIGTDSFGNPIQAPIQSWMDGVITVQVPAGIQPCGIQQQAEYSTLESGAHVYGKALCGELVITAGNGRQSIDSVTVTVGGKKPYVMGPKDTIQGAIDAADPGDLIIVPPGYYHELVVMWKPVRLQGVGAASSTIDASPHPSGILDPWRSRVSCLFGLDPSGRPFTDNSCGSGWAHWTAQPGVPQVDRVPFEAILAWDTTVNGNLAELLQEPSLMGAYEGAAITVVGKGVDTHNQADPFGISAASGFPTGTTLLQTVAGQTDTTGAFRYTDHCSDAHNPYPSNFMCNPSRIDGLSITNSSQGGGGIFVHAWAHNLEISNNRVQNNTGTLTGGVTIGQGEFPDSYVASGGVAQLDPWSCRTGSDNVQLPFCFDVNVNVHNNNISENASTGDELFSATPAGGGGVTFCAGSDYYKFNYNWLCGNLSNGDGGGLAHLGFNWNGDIEHNTIIFNQTTNPTVPTNGGGLIVMGAAPDGSTTTGQECGNTAADTDCPPGLSDGAGPGLVINGNLIQGNAADSGAGGGLRLQAVSGTEVSRFPKTPSQWYTVNLTNNIIVNNVAGWDGAGISLHDSLAVNIVNNTIASNDSTATSGTLFQTFRRDLTSAPPPSSITGVCDPGAAAGCQASQRQPAGLSIAPNSSNLTSSFTTSLTCPAGTTSCGSISNPLLYNNIFWHNRSFHIEVGGVLDQFNQNSVTLMPQLNQSGGHTGDCESGAKYWDLGVRGDIYVASSGRANHNSGYTLNPLYSVLSDTTGYAGSNISSNPLVGEYCNGSKTPPELNNPLAGYQTPPGTDEGNVYTNHYFGLQPGATVDESNNWVQVKWGPLSLVKTELYPGTEPARSTYFPASGSPVIDSVPAATFNTLLARIPSLAHDYLGNSRPDTTGPSDIGAIESTLASGPRGSVSPATINFPVTGLNTNSATSNVTLTNSGEAMLNFTVGSLAAPFQLVAPTSGTPCGTTLAGGASCNIGVRFNSSTQGYFTGTLTINSSNDPVNPTLTVSLTGRTTISASVTPNPLAFGNWPNGSTVTRDLTVTNTGSSALTNFTVTGFTGPFSRVTSGVSGSCPTTPLAAGASCIIRVAFKPTAVQSYGPTNLTVSFTGLVATVPVTGSGVASPASVAIGPDSNPVLTISLAQNDTAGTGSVTFTNTAPMDGTGSQVSVSNVAVTGGGLLQGYLFGVATGGDACTGQTLAPGATCTVAVRFTTTLPGVHESGTITFTGTGFTSPVTGQLAGYGPPPITN